MWPPKPNAFESAIAGSAVDVQRLGLAGHVVEVEALLGLLPAERRRRDPVAQGEDRGDASTAPAAPSRCPIADFVDETGISHGAVAERQP